TQVNVTIIAANGAVQSATATTDGAGNWSVEASNAIIEGEYTVNVSVTDSAGNTGTDSETGVIDTTAPSVTIDAPALTNDNTPVVTGTSDLASSDIAITFTDANGSHTVTVQTNASGNWSAEATQPLVDGAYTVTASITDDAGNTASASDNGVVDTIAPELRIIPSFLLGNLVSLSGDSDLPAGSTITITEHLVGGLIGASYTATTDTDGNWQLLNLTVPLLNLAYVTASATDAAGNISTVSTLDFDNVAPDLTVSVDALSNDTTPVISGDTDMGQGTVINLTVVDSDNVSQTFTAVVQADQTWSVSVPQAIAQGTYTVTASVRDGVGNLTTEQTTGVIDSVAPSLFIDNLAPTANTAPTITGSSNEIGGDVSVTIAGQTLQATVASNGTWQVTLPSALTDGDYTVDVTITDDAGNQQTASATLTIDSTTPVLTITALGVGNDATPTISGTSTEPQGTEVAIVLVDANGDTQQFTALVQADGSYSATPTADIADGDYIVTATITDAANNIGTVQGNGTVDTLDPSLTLNGLGTFNDSTPMISGSSDEIGATVTVNVNDDSNSYQLTAVVQADGSWSVQVIDALNDGAITITANVSDTAGNQASASSNATLDTNAPTISIASLQATMDTTPTISGTTDARDGTNVTIEIIASGIVVQTLTTQALAGQWTIDVSNALVEGSYTVNAVVSEDGLTGSSSTSLAIDLTAPTLAVNSPSITNDTTPLISGTSDAAQGTVVELLITDSTGTEQSVQATVKANGTWSVALGSALAEGSYSIAATITDIAGNSNLAQTTGEIDLTPPTVLIDPLSSTADKTPIVSGGAVGAVAGNTVAVTFTDAQGASHTINTTLAADLTWQVEASQALAEGAYSVTAVVTDTAGNVGQLTANAVIDSIDPEITIDQSSLILTQDTTPLISGTSDEANATVEVTFTDASGTEQVVTVTTDAQGDWQAAANTALAEGVYSVKATITDMAGNQGEDSKTGGEVDITPPALTIVPSFLLGSLVSLSGTSDLPEGSVVTITNHLVGGAVGLPYTATVDANGDWSVLNLSVSLLTLAYVEASATDAAGNTTTISTLDFDNTAPELTLSTPALTMDSTPTISGTTDLGEGAQVTLVVTGQGVATQTFSATVQANGSWSVNVPQDLGDGQYTVQASVRDGVGNLTEQTASGVIDTTAPTLTINPLSITSDATPTISGTSNELGATVTVTIDGQTLTTLVNGSGLWQVTTTTLTDGDYNINATVSDSAGNSINQTANLSIDTEAPELTIAPLSLSNDSTPTISGNSNEPQGSTVSITVVDSNGNTQNLIATIDSNGNWQATAAALPDGTFTATASVTDSAALTTTASTTAVIDTSAPTISVDSIGTINVATPQLSGLTNEPAGTQLSVTVTDNNSSYTYTTQVQADGSWSINVTDSLVDGTITVAASITDLAGNSTTSTSVTGLLNTSAPSIAIVAPADTNDTTPNFSGSSDAVDGSAVVVTVTDSAAQTQTYNTTVVDGLWIVLVTQALSEGIYTVTATVTEAGLTADASVSGLVDITAPVLTINEPGTSGDATPVISGSTDAGVGSIVTIVLVDSLGTTDTVTAMVQAGGVWSVASNQILAEGSVAITASVNDSAGNQGSNTATLILDLTGPVIAIDVISDTNDLTPQITGTVTGAPGNSQVTVLFTDAAGNTQTVTTTTASNGNWLIEPNTALAAGSYTVDVTVQDEYGNATTVQESGVIDTVAPTIAITSGLILTNDATPEISGTSSEAGRTVTLIFDNGIAQTSVTTTTQGDGSWSISPNDILLDGSYTVSATVSDIAGNTTATSAMTGLEIDTIPPSLTNIDTNSILLGLVVTGFDGETDAEDGAIVRLDNALALGITLLSDGGAVVNNGTWNIGIVDVNLADLLGAGLSDARFSITDSIGNIRVVDINGQDLEINGVDVSSAGVEPSAEFSGSDNSTELLSSNDDSIDLSKISSVAPVSELTPQLSQLTVADLLAESEQNNLLALDPVSESNSLVFTAQQKATAEPALDVQNQSEEMIKKLIESGNNQIDS
ncbi:Ig-like domain repeat protein, partial [Pseudoalteromonas sp. SG44-1]|nr:Ig-like domain repeat protein [Pseudoalteromonas sp. SG44-1]